jgi:hypothetical protein
MRVAARSFEDRKPAATNVSTALITKRIGRVKLIRFVIKSKSQGQARAPRGGAS